MFLKQLTATPSPPALFSVSAAAAAAMNFTAGNFSSLNSSLLLPVVTLNKAFPDDASDSRVIDGGDVELGLFQTIVVGCLLSALVGLTVAGNLLVCVTITTDRKLRTPTNYFLLSLAVADMLLGAFVLPVSAFATLNAGRPWPLGAVFCNVYTAADVTLCTASILVLFAISVDRYLAIRFPLRYHQSVGRRLVWKINAAVWVFSAAVGVIPIHVGWNSPDGRVQNVAAPDRCEFQLNAGYALLIGVGTYFAPLVVMCTVYAKILQISRRQVKAIKCLSAGGTNRLAVTSPSSEMSSIVAQYRVAAAVTSVPASPTASSFDAQSLGGAPSTVTSACMSGDSARGVLSGKKLQSKVVSDRKAVVTLASVVAAFAVCWVPYFALFVAKPFLANPVDHRLDQLALWLGYANSSVNPFLYAFHSTSFRDGFRRVLCRRRSTWCQRCWRRDGLSSSVAVGARDGPGRVGGMPAGGGSRPLTRRWSQSAAETSAVVSTGVWTDRRTHVTACRQLCAGDVMAAQRAGDVSKSAELTATTGCCCDRTMTTTGKYRRHQRSCCCCDRAEAAAAAAAAGGVAVGGEGGDVAIRKSSTDTSLGAYFEATAVEELS